MLLMIWMKKQILKYLQYNKGATNKLNIVETITPKISATANPCHTGST
jgi:hypothetical protein